MAEQNLTPTQAAEEQPEEIRDDKILVRMWPKTPVLYPMALLALIFCLIGTFAGSNPHLRNLKKNIEAAPAAQQAEQGETAATAAPADIDYKEEVAKVFSARWVDKAMGVIFLIVLAFSLFTLCVDLEIRWALFTFTACIVVGLLFYIINERWAFLPDFVRHIASLTPIATPQFYFVIFVIWVILMIISLGIVRFHYVRIESNEVIVVGGLLERQQRFPTIRMQYIKDIQDVFEYYLPFVRSGRLVLTFPEQHESIVIDNVLNIEKVIEKLDKISSTLQVSDSHN
ncbi:MAG: hypothetical protein AB1656_07110 [Candidatus Omnitrophota bacterium]